MSSIWMDEFSTTKPEEFVQLNENQWFQHVDIHESTRTMETPDGEEVIEGFAFKTRVMDASEYRDLINTLYTPAQKHIDSSFVSSDDNETAIMEALAEIYEMMAALLPEDDPSDENE